MLSLPAPRLTVLVDRNEKRPLPFPALMPWTFGTGRHKVERTFHLDIDNTQYLPAGDYMLKGYEHICRVERKGAISELMQNLFTRDRARQERSLKKLIDSCRVPYLLLDMHPRECMVDPYVKNPAEVMAEVYRLCAWRGLRLLWLSVGNDVNARRNVGLQVANILWAHAWEYLVKEQTKKRSPTVVVGETNGSRKN